jgi:lysophospholipase L1-like esterase
MHGRTLTLSLFVLVLASFLSLPPTTGQPPPPATSLVELHRPVALRQWSAAIQDLEARDQTEQHPDHSILLVGSSSIRRWETIATDLAPYHPIQRGYGGARWTDVAVFAERLIQPHQFRAVLFFVANDIVGDDNDRTPQEVAQLFAYVLSKTREHAPTAPVFYIAVTPTESRLKAWPQIQASNTAVRAICQRTKNTYFIGTESIFLDSQGHPRPELFVADQLHLSREGYTRWAAAIQSHLDTVLDGAQALTTRPQP